ncbi:hypothetical protein B0H11DRAFT_2205882 [Mycena galericulata]|nr:hypothetical protein B0H11DRAFT_2205882 [Mycena galericulata]
MWTPDVLANTSDLALHATKIYMEHTAGGTALMYDTPEENAQQYCALPALKRRILSIEAKEALILGLKFRMDFTGKSGNVPRPNYQSPRLPVDLASIESPILDLCMKHLSDKGRAGMICGLEPPYAVEQRYELPEMRCVYKGIYNASGVVGVATVSRWLYYAPYGKPEILLAIQQAGKFVEFRSEWEMKEAFWELDLLNTAYVVAFIISGHFNYMKGPVSGSTKSGRREYYRRRNEER